MVKQPSVDIRYASYAGALAHIDKDKLDVLVLPPEAKKVVELDIVSWLDEQVNGDSRFPSPMIKADLKGVHLKVDTTVVWTQPNIGPLMFGLQHS